jgi:hypothetical protein
MPTLHQAPTVSWGSILSLSLVSTLTSSQVRPALRSNVHVLRGGNSNIIVSAVDRCQHVVYTCSGLGLAAHTMAQAQMQARPQGRLWWAEGGLATNSATRLTLRRCPACPQRAPTSSGSLAAVGKATKSACCAMLSNNGHTSTMLHAVIP